MRDHPPRRPSRAASLAAISFVLTLAAGGADAAPFDAFLADGSGADPVNSYLLALASSLAYPGKVRDAAGATLTDRFGDSYRELGLELLATLETDRRGEDMPVLVLADSDLLLVVFRGSEASGTDAILRDWLQTDAQIELVPFGDVRVHRGFSLALGSFYEELTDTLRRLRDGRRLWLTGHSLGGALANLTALQLFRDGIQVTGVVTFASPRVGDAAWQERFESAFGERAQQWIHDHDPVTRLPWSSEQRPYRNVGTINLLGPDHPARMAAQLDGLGVPHPAVHSMKVYASLVYREIEDDGRAAALPPPEPICPIGWSAVGTHPDDGLPLCRRMLSRRIPAGRCRANGGQIVADWCAEPVAGRDRYRARRIE